MKKIILILSSIVLVTILCFLYLYQTADIANKGRNGFDRVFSDRYVKNDHAIANEFKVQKVIGIHGARLYFVSPGAGYLVSTDLDLKDPKKVILEKNEAPPVSYALDSNFIYSYAINENAVSVFDYDGKLLKRVLIKQQFSRIIALTESIFVIRDFKKLMEGVTFVKIKVDSALDEQIKMKELDIESYKNNPFANDGLLVMDRDSGTIVYMNYYHNSFFVMDTTFSKAIRYRTIDTTSLSKLYTKSVKSEKKVGITNYSPANIINRDAVINDGKMHLLSNLAADNQPKDQFSSSTTIDVYQVQSGKYLYSYMLPDCHNNKVKSLLLKDAELISVYPDSIIKYKMN
ncbi:hypothetical protein [Chitinophaga niabensis]|uniref:TolB-like 6-blade propeller-like n=1 Tax=Chitinophaga niabensis TaxID=536979 RepID=A0A1N6D4X1_9BACT|nr:hypothetical protein [Chitinophaga niabensis]SIN65841.1 hypothetical protein SAMN04488055_0275 [Chitinophaga niabensis]